MLAMIFKLPIFDSALYHVFLIFFHLFLEISDSFVFVLQIFLHVLSFFAGSLELEL